MVAKVVHPLDRFLQQRMQEGNISATALVFTFFCDVVTQHDGEIWLGSIIHALAPLPISERLTRTAAFRLQQDGWLQSRKQGRRSYYQLTQTGQNYYKRAANRIYAGKQPDWDGHWTLLFTSMVPENKRDALRRGLLWQGYGRLASSVYALPRDQRPALDQLLSELGVQDNIVVMQAHADDEEPLRKLVLSHWKLDELRQRYKAFTGHYKKAFKALNSKQPASGHSMFLLRILLIHEYRKILLSDPELPVAMLPVDWDGYAARSLTGDIYRLLAETSTEWVSRELLNADGLLPNGGDILKTRFAR